MLFEINITEDCNLDCKYCHEGTISDKTKRYMNIETADKVIDYILKYCDFHKLDNIEISLNGGEPLLNYEVFKYIVIEITKRNKNNIEIEFQTSTNGTLLNDNILKFIAEYKIVTQISLDGFKENNDKNRIFINGNGTFDIVYKNIKEKIKNFGSNSIVISTVITPFTYKNLYNFLLLLIEDGINKINISICPDYQWSLSDFEYLKIELDNFIKMYEKLIIERKLVYINPFDQVIQTIFNKEPYYNKTGIHCSAISGTLAILPNGDILPCGTLIMKNYNNFIISNVSNMEFNLIKLSKFGTCCKIDDICKECEINYRCEPMCYAVNYRNTGNLYEIPKQVCDINKLLIEVCDTVTENLFNNYREETILHFGDKL